MTTIACDGKIIAGDGMVTGNGMIHSTETAKVFRLNSGSVVGFSGSIFLHNDALAFLNGDLPSIDLGDDFEAVILHPGGRCECMDGKGRRYEQPIPCVTGSGSAVALGAMKAGKDAFEAVKIACGVDTGTGGICTYMTPAPILEKVA